VPTIGILMLSAGPDETVMASFRAGLVRSGYVEGQNVRIEFRTAGGRTDRLPRLAEQLVLTKPDVIVTSGGLQFRAAAQATSTIPIVALFHEADPALSRRIDSYRRPGGNVTGVDAREIEVVGKRVELLRELFPSVREAGVLWNEYSHQEMDALNAAARSVGIGLRPIELTPSYDFESIFASLRKMQLRVALIPFSPQVYVRRAQLSTAALRAKVATIHQKEDMVRAGGLISYGTSWDDTWGRAAYFVDRILRGAKPSDLPVEQVSTYRLVINLGTAEELGVAVPQSLLLRADEVVR
jgi:putative ABC transport system substrate-binding protein